MPEKEITLGYGIDVLTVRVPQENLVGVFYPKEPVKSGDEPDEGPSNEGSSIEGSSKEGSSKEETLILKALANPIGAPPLKQLAQNKQRVVIVISDITRPCPSDKLLPPVIDVLNSAGIPDKNITIVIALGLHRPMTAEEISNTVSEAIYDRIQVLNHDPSETTWLGTTSYGTPVEIYRPVVDADLRICLGNIEYHYFAGYSGGAKAILPGCASRASVTANHAMMIRKEAAAGRIVGNPLREDLEEAVAMSGVGFLINVIVDKDHNIQAAVAGDMTLAHRKGCEIVHARGRVSAPPRADIILASAGGFPKDINFYQAHKALEIASYFVKDGGVVILVSACPEGFGNQTFEDWMLTTSTPEAIISKIQKNFVLGGHKAAAIAAIQQRASVFLVSDLDDEIVRKMGITPCNNPQSALDSALRFLGQTSEVCVLPQAISILPEFDPI
jgi:nickel-dependent lactate racemase